MDGKTDGAVLSQLASKYSSPQPTSSLPPVEAPKTPQVPDGQVLQNLASKYMNPTSSLPDITSPRTQLPDDVVKAQGYVDNPEMNQHQGMCQQFVEQVTQGKTGIYPSAIDAWNAQQDKAVKGLQGIKKGDILYFTPNASNEGYGHTGIYEGDGKFISATDNGVKSYNLTNWNNLTGQQPLGYLKNGSR